MATTVQGESQPLLSAAAYRNSVDVETGKAPGTWNGEVFECSGDFWGTCCFAAWCPCWAFPSNVMLGLPKVGAQYAGLFVVIYVAQLSLRIFLQFLQRACVADSSGQGERCMMTVTVICFVIIILTLALTTVGAAARSALRLRYGIPGDKCGDWCCWFWCTPCTLAQELRTVNKMESGADGLHALRLAPEEPVRAAPMQQAMVL